jgi:Holliday junction resolvase-like predicted endonuclease
MMKNIFVVKYNGEKQSYDQKKVLNSIIRSGINKQQALNILVEVEKKLFDEISTKELYQIVAGEIENFGFKPGQQTYKLREALGRMGSFDFEKFVQQILQKEGFECAYDTIVGGECSEHQVDIIAQKEQKLYYVEVKHHRNFHRNSGLGTVCEVQARYEDMKNGYGKKRFNFTQAWLFTNTKISNHAKKYASCKNIKLTSWKFDSEDLGLEKRIEKVGTSQIERIIRAVYEKKTKN